MIARLFLLLFLSAGMLFSQPYPDQHYFYEKEGLVKKISSLNGLQVSNDGKSIVLSDGVLTGTALFEPDSSQYPFNHGLPSWNGLVASESNTGFRVLIRFYSNGWSPWLTAGYWKNNIWPSYGATSFTGGKIDIDEVILNSYLTKWQFQVEMTRTSASLPSPSLRRLSFFVSDQQTTSSVNISSIVNDKPAAIFIPTDFFCQYDLDNTIGGSICSPTSTSMVIRSYKINVDPLQYAKDNYDPYHKIYGVWPRTVQNAVKYGLTGSVTRYRNWSDAQKVLASGGRIVMSVGKPLYSGHLIMLAGFDNNGNPICHDPAQHNGYSYMWDKASLSQSWFVKGGVSYTFFKEDSVITTSVETNQIAAAVKDFHVSNYPNPFNMQTTVRIEIPVTGYTTVKAFDISGREVDNIFEGTLISGTHAFRWSPTFLPTGNYFIHVISGNFTKTIKSLLLK